MTDRSKQIIPNSQAVVRFLDEEAIKVLDCHGTFTIEELLEKTNNLSSSKLSIAKVSAIFRKARSVGNYSDVECFNDLQHAIISSSKDVVGITNKLAEGTTCNLLQPDGKGWLKGTLKICFEFKFIPEEDESVTVAIEQNPVETQYSPLDDIRQQVNSLQIEQN
jgi:KGK domain